VTKWLLTVSALADMQNIYSFGEETWGPGQARRYAEELYELFREIARYPGIGLHRPELRDQLRSFPHASHVVFYILWNEQVVIARVLHGAMDYDDLFESYDPIADLPTN
jgi:toxin ParE1/3/4